MAVFNLEVLVNGHLVVSVLVYEFICGRLLNWFFINLKDAAFRTHANTFYLIHAKL